MHLDPIVTQSLVGTPNLIMITIIIVQLEPAVSPPLLRTRLDLDGNFAPLPDADDGANLVIGQPWGVVVGHLEHLEGDLRPHCGDLTKSVHGVVVRSGGFVTLFRIAGIAVSLGPAPNNR